MCGIAGIFSFRGNAPSEDRARSMARSIVHRGPDDEGYFSSGPLSMGMRRLSIIDLESGRQPISGEDGSVTVVFNGEIYNYRELTEELKKLGHVFKTKCDTETIAHLYEEYGSAFVEKLNGMFAIALWDEKIKKLYLFRDRLGIKPVFYMEQDDELLFGSEIKCLSAGGGRLKGPDPQALDYYFTSQYFPAEKSIYRNVKKLLAGHYLEITDAGMKMRRYWTPGFHKEKLDISETEAIEKFRELFRRSVQRRLVADVPLGAFLSGGVDSSAVVSIMSEMTGGDPVRTFSIGFGEEAPEFNELPHVETAARHAGATMRTWVVKPQELLERLDKIIHHFDEPFGGGLHTFLVSEIAAKEVKVALTGIGADELLWGYERQKKARLVSMYSKLPGPARAALRAGASALGSKSFSEKASKLDRLASSTVRELYFDWICVFDKSAKETLYAPAFKNAVSNGISDYAFEIFGDQIPADFNDMISCLELKTTLADDFLNYTDRTSMAWSLEARVPFLDHELVEFVVSLPHEFKTKGGVTKYLLKKSMEGILPDEIIYRKKQPFFLPLGTWFRGGLKPLVVDCLLSSSPAYAEYLNPDAVRIMAVDHLEGKADNTWKLWSVILFEKWMIKNQ